MEELNDHARAIHAMLDSLLCKLSSEFEGMEYSLGNVYEITYNDIENPLPFSEQFTRRKIKLAFIQVKEKFLLKSQGILQTIYLIPYVRLPVQILDCDS